MTHQPAFVAHLRGAATVNEGTVDLVNDVHARRILDNVNTNSRTYIRTAKAINDATAAFDNDDLDAFKQMVSEVSQMVHNHMSHRVLTRRIQFSTLWVAMVRSHRPGTTVEAAWEYKIVKEHILKFLIYVVEITKPQKGFSVIRSTTLMQAMHTIASLVIQFTHEPVTLRKKGFSLLSAEGFFTKLEDELMYLIRKYKLDRTRHTPMYLTRDCLFILIVTILNDSEESSVNRMVNMQTIVRLLLSYYSTCRPSSLGWTEKKWLDAGEYPKIGDVRIYRRAYMKYDIVFNLKQFKGAINTVDANQQTFTLGGVLYAHNGIFDITVATLSLFFMRGVFLKKYASPQELFDDTSAEILIDPAFKDTPLFLATETGGRGFSDQAASSLSATETLGHWLGKIGFPKMGYTAIRRDGGTYFGQAMGLDYARNTMNHHHEGNDVLRTNYDRGTDNHDQVGVRNGEVAGALESRPGEVMEKTRERHAFREFVVDWMVRVRDVDVKVVRRERQVGGRVKVTGDPRCIEIQAALNTLYPQYIACFTPPASEYNENRGNVTRIMKMAKGITKRIKDIHFRNGTETKAEDLQTELYRLYDEKTSVFRKINRATVRQQVFEQTQSYRNDPIQGTTDDRDKALHGLKDQHLETIQQTVERYRVKLLPGVQLAPVAVNQEAITAFENADPAECRYNGDLLAWANNLNREVQIQQHIGEQEEAIDDSVRLLMNTSKSKGKENQPAASTSAPTIAPIPIDDDMDTMPDNDESMEIDVFGLDMAEVRRSLFMRYVEPFLKHREISTIEDGGKKTFPCGVCITRGFPKAVFKNFATWDRHQNQMHSEYKELEWTKMKRPGSTSFYCPSDRCTFKADKVKSVFYHMTAKCCEQDKWQEMKVEHDKEVSHLHAPKKYQESNAIIPATNEDLIGLAEMMDWFHEDDWVDGEIPHFEDDDKTSGVVDWSKVNLVNMKGLDYNAFCTTAAPFDAPMDLEYN